MLRVRYHRYFRLIGARALKYSLVQQVSQPQRGYAENDDCAACLEAGGAIYAWVIDGATSVADRSYLGAALGDVAWYSQALCDALSSFAATGASPKVLHALAAGKVAHAYEQGVGSSPVPLYARPAAAVTIVRLEGDEGQLFYLADCPAFTLSRTGRVMRITDMQRTDGEQDLRDRVAASQAREELTPKQMFLEQIGWLRTGREEQLKNRPLAVSAAISGATFGGFERRIDLADCRALVLMSDGFERYSAQYRLGDDAAMVRAVVREGAAAVLEQIRSLERDDELCRKIPRLKASDDATCLVLTRDP
ncbi:MAG TPA: protein phosphatase 2C domain-containing protein [Steroidobacteraceae bacterium]